MMLIREWWHCRSKDTLILLKWWLMAYLSFQNPARENWKLKTGSVFTEIPGDWLWSSKAANSCLLPTFPLFTVTNFNQINSNRIHWNWSGEYWDKKKTLQKFLFIIFGFKQKSIVSSKCHISFLLLYYKINHKPFTSHYLWWLMQRSLHVEVILPKLPCVILK